MHTESFIFSREYLSVMILETIFSSSLLWCIFKQPFYFHDLLPFTEQNSESFSRMNVSAPSFAVIKIGVW